MLAVELLVVLGLTLLNGFFAMSELAIVSSRRVRLEAMAEAGDAGAAMAAELARDPSRFFSAVQFGITLLGFGLNLINIEMLHQLKFWLIFFTNNPNHRINI